MSYQKIELKIKELKERLDALEKRIEALEQEQCDKCEVGNPCLYCKHEFEPQESEVRNDY